MKVILSAPVLMFLLFAGVTITSVLSNEYYPYSDKYLEYLTLCWVLYCVGYFLLRFVEFKTSDQRKPRNIELLVKLYLFGIGIGIVFNVLNFCFVVGAQCLSPQSVLLYRILLIDEKAPTLPGVSLFNFFFFVSIVFCYVYRMYLSRPQIVYVLLCATLFVIMSSARSSLFLIILISYYFYVLGKDFGGRLILQGIAMVGLLFLGFALMGELVGKSISELSFLSYFIAPSHALDAILNNEAGDRLSGIWLSFGPLHGIISRIYGIEFNSFVLPNFLTPHPTNVYTILGVYVNDYGQVGALFWIIFFGIIAGLLENFYWRDRLNSYLRLLYALNLSVLTLAVFHDYYTTSGIVWFIVLIGAVFFRPDATKTRKSF